jgi:hypothetical protein
MTATEAMARAGTCFFDHGDQRRRPLCSRVSPPTGPALSCEFPGTVPLLSTVPLLGLRSLRNGLGLGTTSSLARGTCGPNPRRNAEVGAAVYPCPWAQPATSILRLMHICLRTRTTPLAPWRRGFMPMSPRSPASETIHITFIHTRVAHASSSPLAPMPVSPRSPRSRPEDKHTAQ